MQMQIT